MLANLTNCQWQSHLSDTSLRVHIYVRGQKVIIGTVICKDLPRDSRVLRTCFTGIGLANQKQTGHNGEQLLPVGV